MGLRSLDKLGMTRKRDGTEIPRQARDDKEEEWGLRSLDKLGMTRKREGGRLGDLKGVFGVKIRLIIVIAESPSYLILSQLRQCDVRVHSHPK
jgi:hypothetical protein